MSRTHPDDLKTLYVQQATRDRLLATGRISLSDGSDKARMVFPDHDPDHAGQIVAISKEVAFNAVHRRRWDEYQGRQIFEQVADI